MTLTWRGGLKGVIDFLQRYPWLLPLISFVSGVASYIMVSRGEGMARLIAALSLIGWPWLLVQSWLTRRLEKHTGALTPYMLQMVTQSLQQEILFFALPFMFAVLQPDSGQWIFTGLACAAAALSVVDPLYERWVSHRPATGLLFHAYCSFVVTLVALPIVAKVQLESALPLALGLTGVWLLLGLPKLWVDLGNRRSRLLGFAGVLAAALAVWLLRAHIPAAGLAVNDSRITQQVEEHQPGAEVRRLSVAELKQNGIIAFVAIHAPMGLKQTVVFRWTLNGEEVDSASAEIQGNRKSWRTYSRKRNFPADPRGRWRVDLLTPDGQLLTRLAFTVDDGAPQKAGAWTRVVERLRPPKAAGGVQELDDEEVAPESPVPEAESVPEMETPAAESEEPAPPAEAEDEAPATKPPPETPTPEAAPQPKATEPTVTPAAPPKVEEPQPAPAPAEAAPAEATAPAPEPASN